MKLFLALLIVLASSSALAQTSTFNGYAGGACGAAATCTVNVTAQRSVVATFNLIPASGALEVPPVFTPEQEQQFGKLLVHRQLDFIAYRHAETVAFYEPDIVTFGFIF